MTTEAAIKFFGGVKRLSEALNGGAHGLGKPRMAVQSIYGWGEFPPNQRQFEIEIKTGGALKVEERLKTAPTKRTRKKVPRRAAATETPDGTNESSISVDDFMKHLSGDMPNP